MAAFSLVNLLEDLNSFFLAYTALEYPSDAALVQFVIDDGVGTCSAFDLPGGELVRRGFIVGTDRETIKSKQIIVRYLRFSVGTRVSYGQLGSDTNL